MIRHFFLAAMIWLLSLSPASAQFHWTDLNTVNGVHFGVYINAVGCLTDLVSLMGTNGGRVFRTTNAGQSWSTCYQIPTSTDSTQGYPCINHIYRCFGGIVLMAASNGDYGIYRSTDAGSSWNKVDEGTPHLGATRFVEMPNGDIIAACVQGIKHSSDHGLTWTSRSNFPCGMVHDMIYDQSGRLYLGSSVDGVMVSENGGFNWESLGTGLKNLDVWAVAAPSNSLLCGTFSGDISRLDPGSQSWVPANAGLTDIHVICMETVGTSLLVGTPSGILLSTDQGETWSDASGNLAGLGALDFCVMNDFIYVATDAGVFKAAKSSVTSAPSAQPSMEFALRPCYPNPFNSTTTIRYSLPHRSHVTLDIYNMLGEEVAELVNGDVEAGYHEVRFNAMNLASGMYLYRLRTGEVVQTRKLVLMR